MDRAGRVGLAGAGRIRADSQSNVDGTSWNWPWNLGRVGDGSQVGEPWKQGPGKLLKGKTEACKDPWKHQPWEAGTRSQPEEGRGLANHTRQALPGARPLLRRHRGSSLTPLCALGCDLCKPSLLVCQW